jgi:hypothetical protein
MRLYAATVETDLVLSVPASNEAVRRLDVSRGVVLP